MQYLTLVSIIAAMTAPYLVLQVLRLALSVPA